MFEGMTVEEVRAELRKSVPPMTPEPREVTLRRLARWAKEIGLDAQAAPGQPIPKDMEPDDPKPTKEQP